MEHSGANLRPPGEGGPISLRVSVTDRCRFRCLYCTPAEGVERFAPGDILRYEEILHFVRLLQGRAALAKVHITGGEPLDRREITTLVAMLAGEGVADLAMTTNAQRLGELAEELKRSGLGRVNVTLNSLHADTFRRVTGGGELARTLEGVDAALRAGLAPLKFNTTVIRGVNDGEVADIARFAMARGAVSRFIELMPLGPVAQRHQEWFVPAGEVLDQLRRCFDLQPLPRRAGTSSRDYRAEAADGLTGVLGVIAPCSEPFCADCNRLRLTANGELLGCLAAKGGQSVLHLLRSGKPPDDLQVLDRVQAVMGRKRSGDGFASDRCMAKVGG